MLFNAQHMLSQSGGLPFTQLINGTFNGPTSSSNLGPWFCSVTYNLTSLNLLNYNDIIFTIDAQGNAGAGDYNKLDLGNFTYITDSNCLVYHEHDSSTSLLSLSSSQLYYQDSRSYSYFRGGTVLTKIGNTNNYLLSSCYNQTDRNNSSGGYNLSKKIEAIISIANLNSLTYYGLRSDSNIGSSPSIDIKTCLGLKLWVR